MILRLLAGAMLCVLTIHVADARPRHHHHGHHHVLEGSLPGSGCSDPFMGTCGGALNFQLSSQHTDLTHSFVKLPENPAIKRMGPGLHRVMAEGAGRVAKPTCADVRAMVAMIGEAKAEAAARSAGATDQQIREARRCLISSAR